MLINLIVASIGGSLLSSSRESDRALGTALVGAATWWMLRDVKEA